ncbi:MAG: hypothetical protein CMO81_09390 [Waddliaceae bacterium]|nr:hypothetical protein [Waddliaceae bacterium]
MLGESGTCFCSRAPRENDPWSEAIINDGENSSSSQNIEKTRGIADTILHKAMQGVSKIGGAFECLRVFSTPQVTSVTTLMGIFDKLFSVLEMPEVIDILNDYCIRHPKASTSDLFHVVYAIEVVAIPADVLAFLHHLEKAYSVQEDKNLSASEKASRLAHLGLHLGSDIGTISLRVGKVTKLLALIPMLAGISKVSGWLVVLSGLLAAPELILEGQRAYGTENFRKKVLAMLPEEAQKNTIDAFFSSLSGGEFKLDKVLGLSYEGNQEYAKFWQEITKKLEDGEISIDEYFEHGQNECEKMKERVNKVQVHRLIKGSKLSMHAVVGILLGASLIGLSTPLLMPVTMTIYAAANGTGLLDVVYKYFALGDANDLAPSDDWMSVYHYFCEDAEETKLELTKLKTELDSKKVLSPEANATLSQLTNIMGIMRQQASERLGALLRRKGEVIQRDIETICRLLESKNDKGLGVEEAIHYTEKAISWRKQRVRWSVGVQSTAVVGSVGALIAALAMPQSLPITLAAMGGVGGMLLTEVIVFHIVESSHLTSKNAQKIANTYKPGLGDKILKIFTEYFPSVSELPADVVTTMPMAIPLMTV